MLKAVASQGRNQDEVDRLARAKMSEALSSTTKPESSSSPSVVHDTTGAAELQKTQASRAKYQQKPTEIDHGELQFARKLDTDPALNIYPPLNEGDVFQVGYHLRDFLLKADFASIVPSSTIASRFEEYYRQYQETIDGLDIPDGFSPKEFSDLMNCITNVNGKLKPPATSKERQDRYESGVPVIQDGWHDGDLINLSEMRDCSMCSEKAAFGQYVLSSVGIESLLISGSVSWDNGKSFEDHMFLYLPKQNMFFDVANANHEQGNFYLGRPVGVSEPLSPSDFLGDISVEFIKQDGETAIYSGLRKLYRQMN